ncbi:MAG: hypothetical protein ACI35P_02855 [Bacillus sp. (in: firmicutes)]
MEESITSNVSAERLVDERPVITSDILNLPDLHFFLYCQEQYKLNKGVFNTIDNWFYKNGIVNIIDRRIYLLTFLQYVKECNLETNKYIKFGIGGLTKKLNEFVRDQERKNYFI